MRWLFLFCMTVCGWLPLHAAVADADIRPATGAKSGAQGGSEISVGLLENFPPFQIWPAAGTPSGLDVDLLEHLGRASGLTFRYQRFVRFEDMVQALKEHRIQLITATAQSSERATFLRFSRPYASVPQAFVGRGDLTSVPSSPDLAGRRLAVVRGHVSQAIASERFPMASRPAYGTVSEALDAVANGSADMVIELLPTLRQLAAERLGSGLMVSRTFGFPEGHLRLATGLADEALMARLDAGLLGLGPAAVKGLSAPWLVAAATGAADSASAAAGVARERPQEQPKEQPKERPLRVAYFPQDRPYSFGGIGGAPEGIGIEMMKAVAQRAGLDIEAFVPMQLAEMLKALSENRVDVGMGLTDTEVRRSSMGFVGPYRSNPLVLTSRQQYSVWNLDQLGGRRLAILKGFFGEAFIRATYPTIAIVNCDTVNACLDRVEDDSADAFLYGLQGLYERLQSRQSRKLQITGTVGGLFDEHNLGLALARSPLGPRLRDALALVVEQDLPRIESDWATREAAPKLDWQRARQGGALLLGLLVASLLAWWAHSRRLRTEFLRTRRAQAEAEKSRAASEEYLAFMAHEVRNSLQSVSGAVTLIHQPGTPARQQSLLNALARSSRSTLALLNSLLDRHRLQEGRLSLILRPEHLSAVLQDVIEQTRPAALAKGLTLRSSHSGGSQPLQADALRLQQIVRNLLVNAIKFSQRGEVTVHLNQQALGAELSPTRCQVLVSVQDQGPGLDEATQQQIFERHYSRGGDRPGSGLGLGLSRDLAHSLGGTLTVRSVPAQGATFELRFEADIAQPQTPGPQAAPSRVLVVEDSPVYMILLEQALQNQGLSSVAADSLGQARKLLGEAPADHFDLVLCDAHLPDGHVAGLLDWLTRQRADGRALPPLMCMSAEFIADEAEALRRMGALGALTKDADVAAFVRSLLGVLSQPVAS